MIHYTYFFYMVIINYSAPSINFAFLLPFTIVGISLVKSILPNMIGVL